MQYVSNFCRLVVVAKRQVNKILVLLLCVFIFFLIPSLLGNCFYFILYINSLVCLSHDNSTAKAFYGKTGLCIFYGRTNLRVVVAERHTPAIDRVVTTNTLNIYNILSFYLYIFTSTIRIHPNFNLTVKIVFLLTPQCFSLEARFPNEW